MPWRSPRGAATPPGPPSPPSCQSTSWPYTRRRPDRDDVTIDLRPFLIEADLDPQGVLRFRLKITPAGSARSEEVIDALGLRDLLETGAVLVRTEVELIP